MKTVIAGPDFSRWRQTARALLAAETPPAEVFWVDESEPGLFASCEPASGAVAKTFQVPREFHNLAELVACYRSKERWSLLYRLLFRLTHGERQLLRDSVDRDVSKAQDWAKAIRKDIHKAHAFVRFKTESEGYVAYHEPAHYILRLAAPFFVRRFGDKPWSILTPDEGAHWDLHHLTFSKGIPAHLFQHTDPLDDLWKSYYKSIYNPARINLKLMRGHMAPKYWRTMPEAELINAIKASTPVTLQTMAANENTAAEVSPDLDLAGLRKAASQCQACPLFQPATQSVFGEGQEHAPIMIVGEQPGDEEDRAGRPFVGPSGAVLEQALTTAGLNRGSLYVTNAVKHFKFAPRGKFRLHQKPTGRESQACRPWLEAEVRRVQPKVIVALGTTAGTSVLGWLPKLSVERGRVLRGRRFGVDVILSWHPAAILRSAFEEEKAQRLQQLCDDLQLAKQLL